MIADSSLNSAARASIFAVIARGMRGHRGQHRLSGAGHIDACRGDPFQQRVLDQSLPIVLHLRIRIGAGQGNPIAANAVEQFQESLVI